jgi:hypothetical protein
MQGENQNNDVEPRLWRKTYSSGKPPVPAEAKLETTARFPATRANRARGRSRVERRPGLSPPLAEAGAISAMSKMRGRA